MITPIRFYTAVQVLFHPVHLGLVEIPAKNEKWLLIYGGSSAFNRWLLGAPVLMADSHRRLRRYVCYPARKAC